MSIPSACRNLHRAKDLEQTTALLPPRNRRRQIIIWLYCKYLLGRLGNTSTSLNPCVYANGRAIKQLSQPIVHPQQAWLDIVHTYILENETDSDCDDGDVVPQVVDGVHDIESDDESLQM